MRYDDASNAGSAAADNAPVARPDVDSVASGGFQPATGNAISGAGTVSGAAGADTVGDAPGKIVEVHGAGGATTMSGESFQAVGQYGVLNMSAQGDFSYVRNPSTPEAVQDVFGYTLADRDGGTSATTLTIDVGQTPAQAALALADGAVTLPAGVEMSDIRVVGRDLVINMPDGSQMVIPGGAVFVPNLIIGDVEVPPANLAQLLIDSEPKPGAGPIQSSGGPPPPDVPPLDPGVPLGDLIPPTDLGYTPPEFEDLGDFVDDEPGIVIIPDGQPAAIAASDEVDESGLAERPGEPEGTLEPQNIETTSGVISIDAGDGIDSVTIVGDGDTLVISTDTQVGDTVQGARGVLTITSIDLDAGTIGYTYTVTDNTIIGQTDEDDFSVTVTDDDGDTATATLHIDILDDGPIARDDTDAVAEDATSTTGNVITGSGTTSLGAGADTEGADGTDGETNDSIDGLTGIRAGTTGSFTAVAQNGTLTIIEGQFGTLKIDVDGNYTYTKHADVGNGGTDVFTYQLTDGDGTTDTATLTIGVPANPNDTPEVLRVEDTLVDEDGLKGANVDGTPLRPGETDSTESATDTGQILVDYKGDVPANLMNAITLVDSPALDGQLHADNGDPITFTLEGGELVGRANGVGDPLVVISITGAVAGSGGQVTYTYQVELLGPVQHPDPGSEDSIQLIGVDFQITDSNGDHATGEFDVTIVDDLPVAREPEPDPQHPNDPPPPLVSAAVDEDDLPDGNSDVASGDDLADPSPTTVGGGAGSLGALFNAGADSPMKNFGLVDDTSGLPVLHSDGHDVLYDIDVTAGTLTAYADTNNNGLIDDGDASKVFTLTVNPDGSWSFTLQGNLDHDSGDSENNLQLDLGSIVTAEDQDGDPATAADGAFVIDVDDDIPTARTPEPDPDHPNDPPPPLVSGAVDEDDLEDGNSDVADGDDLADPSSTIVSGAAGSLGALFNAGADGPMKNFGLVDDPSKLPVLTSNDHAVLYSIDTATGTLTAYADLDNDGFINDGAGAKVFTLQVNPDGSWSFTLQGQLDHPDEAPEGFEAYENNLPLDLGGIITAEDQDGDPATAAGGAFVIDVDDDIPTAREPQPSTDPEGDPIPLLYGAVDEDDLDPENGDNSLGNKDHLDGDDEPVDNSGDSDATTTGGPAGSLDALFNAGADNPLTYTLNGDTSALEAQNLSSNGHALLYSVNGDNSVLTAYADLNNNGELDDAEAVDGNTVFTLTIGEDGSWLFNLQDQIDHSIPGTEDNVPIDFGAAVIATDSDGDSVPGAPGAFIVDVDDDMPKPFDDPNDPEDDVCPDDVIIVNSDDGHFHGSLNLPPVGADDPGKATFGVSNGDPVLDGDNNPISAEGQELFYFINGDGVLEAREGGESGKIVFTITINLDSNGNPDGTFDYDQFVDISSTTTLHLADFDAVGGGNVDAKAVDIPNSQFDLIVSTKDGDSVNTNNDTFGVSDGQSFKAGELIRFDLVQNAFTTGSGGGAVVNFGEYYTANGFRQDVSGLASGQFGNFTVKVFVAVENPAGTPADPADGDGVFYNDGNDAVVPVTQLNIYDASGVLVDIAAYNASNDPADPNIVVTNNGDGSWTVTGLPNNFDYEITSDTAFNAVQLEAIAGTGTFKLGAIDITTITQTDVDFSVPVVFTDADGDPVTCDIDVILGPPTNTPNVTAQVNEAGLDSIGSDGGSDSETTGGDLSAIVSGGSGTITFGLVGDGNNDGVLVGTHGTMTLNQATGVWTYTLTSPVDGTTANNGANVVPNVENFQYQMYDNGVLVGTGNITVKVVDDVPTALDDTDVITEGDANEQGNVITGAGTTNDPAGDDTLGADGATVTGGSHPTGGAGIVDGVTGNVTIVGLWGSVVIEPDGDYTYTLSTEGAAALEAKGEGQTLADEVFTYTLTDGDGDKESATLTITPTGTNDNPGLTVPDTGDDTRTVYEAGLGGTPAGTAEAADGDGGNNSVNSEQVTGAFSYTPGDGATVITVDGAGVGGPLTIPLAGPFPTAAIAGSYGNLVITGVNTTTHVVSYTYTLSDNINHNDANPDQDDFTITVDDSDGSTADKVTDTLTINIADDTPIADDDTDVIDEGDLTETGNVITGAGTTSGLAGDDRVGADDATVTGGSHPTGGAGIVDGVTGNVTIVGLWGTVVIEPDGDYTYTLSAAGTTALNALGANQTLTPEVFTYTLKDGDTSSDTATLTITPKGADDQPGLNVPDTGADTKTVYEAGLGGTPAGTAEAADGDGGNNSVNSEQVTGTFSYTPGDGATVITVDGAGVGGPLTIPLAGPFPTAAIAGSYGNLVITGVNTTTHVVSYTYTLGDNINHNDGNPDQDDFTITVDDSDGSTADKVTDTLTINIADDIPIADDDTDALTEGETSQSGNVITGAGTTSGLAGDDRVGADGATVTGGSHPTGGAGTVDGSGNVTIVGLWGSVVIAPGGGYTYTLSPAGQLALEAKGANQTLAPEVFTYTLKDGDTSSDTATLTISLTGTDDTPTLTVPDTGADIKNVDEAGLPTRTGELAGTGEAVDANANNDDSEKVNGTFSFTPGDGATVVTIDGAGAGGPLTIPLAGPFPTAAVVGSYGSIVITGVSGNTISYTYTLTDNVNHATQTPQDDFTITVDDSDGSTADKVTDTLTIHIIDDEPLNYQPDVAIVENSGTDTFTGKLDDDDTLANDGGADSIASLVWNTGVNGTILLDVDGNQVKAGGQPVKLYIQPDGSLKATTDNSNAAMTVFTATLNAGTSSYTIDFDRPLDNGSSSASDFTGAKAGNNAWIGIDPDLVNGAAIDIAAANDPNPDSVDLLITGFDHTTRVSTTVNRDSDDIGAGTGQANDPNESLRIDFVQDLRRDAGVDESTAGGYDFDNHVGQKVFSFTMVDPKAGGNTAVLLEAFNVTNEATSKTDVHAIGNNTPVEIDPASIVVKLGNTVLVAGVNYNVYDAGNGVYVSPIPAGAVITFQAVGGATFEAVEITNAAGHDIPGPTPGNFSGADFAIGGFSYGVNDPGDPVEFHLPTLLTDGDGDTSSGTVDVTVYPVGQEPAHALAPLTQTTLAKTSADSSSLLATNDNSTQKQDSTNTMVLTAAIAAAGLSSQPLAASTDDTHGRGHDGVRGPKGDQLSSIASDSDGGADNKSVEGGQKSVDTSAQPAAHGHHGNDNGDSHESSVSTAHEQVQAPAELLEGTDTPTQSEADAAQFVAPAIVMPTAAQLEAATGSATEGKPSSVDGSEGEMHTDTVAKVLADALNGGGNGPDIEALINTLPGKGGKGLDALASHGHGGVPNGDTADFAGFTGGHGMHTMDHMAVHQDAAPAHG